MSYGVAMISRLLRIIGLFSKRALYKWLYSAKRTYNFMEPTNRSHPVLTQRTIHLCFYPVLRVCDPFSFWAVSRRAMLGDVTRVSHDLNGRHIDTCHVISDMTYEWVMPHMNESCHIWMRWHVSMCRPWMRFLRRHIHTDDERWGAGVEYHFQEI